MWSVCGIGAQEAESDGEEAAYAKPDGEQVELAAEDLKPEAECVLGYIIWSICIWSSATTFPPVFRLQVLLNLP